MKPDRVFNIQGSVPPGEGKSYATHVRSIVVTDDITTAIDLVAHKYPGIVIHNIQHHGIVDIIAVRKDPS